LKYIQPTGAIIVGTGMKNQLTDSIGGKFISRVAHQFPVRRSPVINKLGFLGYDEHFRGNTRNRWLSENYANIHEFNRDPLSGNVMSNTPLKETLETVQSADRDSYIDTDNKSAKYL